MAEYSTNLNPAPQVAYLTNDHLGSPRINTNENGAVISRHDYRPYGEEITERTHTQYAADTIRKQFTGYERDGETNLDFAQARMYSVSTGRFTGPDSLLGSGRIQIPQSWNRFTYVTNRPLSFIDSSGQFEWSTDLGGHADDSQLLEAANSISDESKRKRAIKKANKQIAERNRIRHALMSAALLTILSKTLSAEQKQQVIESLAAYGSERDGNNVVLGFGNNSGGQTSLNKKTGIVNVTFRQEVNDVDLVSAVAHEGQHVGDYNAYWNSGVPNSSIDRTDYERETRAYLVSSYIVQAMGVSVYDPDVAESPKYYIWNKGWLKLDSADRESKRGAGVRNFLEYNNNLTPVSNSKKGTGPGIRISQEADL